MNPKQLVVLVSILVALGVGFWWAQTTGAGPAAGSGAAPDRAAGVAEPAAGRSGAELERVEPPAAGAPPEAARAGAGSAAGEPATASGAASEVTSGLALRALDAGGQPLANRQLVAALEVPGSLRPVAEFVARTDGAGRARFPWSEAWSRPELAGVHFTVLGGREPFAAGSEPPPSRPGPQVFVELAGFAEREPQPLGDQVLLRPSERFPAALVQGRAVSSGGGILESLWGNALVPRSAAAGPARGGLELVLLGDGAFEVFGPPELATVQLAFASRDHLQIDDALVETPANGVEIELLLLQRVRGRLRLPEGLEPNACYVWMASEEVSIGISVAADGSFDAEGQQGAFRLAVTQTADGWELWAEEFADVEAFGAGGAERTLDLRASVRALELEPIDATAAPLVEQGLDARLDGQRVARFATDAEGRLRIALPPGAQRLELRRGAASAWSEVPLAGGDRLVVSVE